MCDEKKTCEAIVCKAGAWNSHVNELCGKSAKVQHNGVWLCGVHLRVKKRLEAREIQRQEQSTSMRIFGEELRAWCERYGAEVLLVSRGRVELTFDELKRLTGRE